MVHCDYSTLARSGGVLATSRTLAPMPTPSSRRESGRSTAPTVASHLAVMAVVSAILGVLVAGLAIPFAGVVGRRRQGRQQGHGQPPGRAGGQGAGPEDPHLRRQRQPHRLALRPEPHQRPAEPDLAQDGAGDRRHRGLPLLPARRPRHPRHAARLRHQPGQRLGAGRVVDHPADGQADPAQPGGDQEGGGRRHRRHLRPQAARAALRDRLREELLQGLDPRALPQHRLLRRRRVRRPVGRPALLLQERQEPQPRAVRAARRPGQEPHRLRPDQLPRARPQPAQRRPRPDGPARRDRAGQGRQAQGSASSASRSSGRPTAASSPRRRSSATTPSTT